MHLSRPSPSISEQAAAWVLRLQSAECNEQDRQSCEAWLADSEAHRREFEVISKMWRELDRAAPGLRGQVHRHKSTRALPLLLAALLVAGGQLRWSLGFEELYQTRLGERHHIALADGSSLDLNADSQVRVTLSFWSRHITLERGEMLLDVARDARRPLEVEVAGTRLRDIGTRFNVHLHGQQVVTTVLDGAVEATDRSGHQQILLAGQKLRFNADQLGRPEPVRTTDATAWIEGRWQFQDTPLRDVINELNHYRATPVELADPGLGELQVSGTFRCEDHAGLLRAVQTLFGLQLSQQNGRTVLGQRPL